MQIRKGWAALLALVIFLILISDTALAVNGASDGRPIFGCFNPRNAELIGRLGPGDASVRHAFEMGGCLALMPDTPVSNHSRQGAVWRFQAYGSAVPVFAPEWGAGFGDARRDDVLVRDFSPFVPATARLLSEGRLSVYCDAASADLTKRWNDFKRRWDRFEAGRGRSPGSTVFVLRRHWAETGPKLMAEGEALRSEGAELQRRCAPVRDVELDDMFIAFIRSAGA